MLQPIHVPYDCYERFILTGRQDKNVRQLLQRVLDLGAMAETLRGLPLLPRPGTHIGIELRRAERKFMSLTSRVSSDSWGWRRDGRSSPASRRRTATTLPRRCRRSHSPRKEHHSRSPRTPRNRCYIIPNEPVGLDAFAVIREAMRSKAVVALGRVVLSKRERVMALEPYDKAGRSPAWVRFLGG